MVWIKLEDFKGTPAVFSMQACVSVSAFFPTGVYKKLPR